jgi:hypothetical protein
MSTVALEFLPGIACVDCFSAAETIDTDNASYRDERVLVTGAGANAWAGAAAGSLTIRKEDVGATTALASVATG